MPSKSHAQTSQQTSQQNAGASRETEIRRLEERIARLEASSEEKQNTVSPETEELRQLKLNLQLPDLLTEGYSGFGAGMSKVYFSKTPFAVGSTGEVFYSASDDGTRATDLARLNLFLGYRFSGELVFNSGLAFENGPSFLPGDQAPARVEFAYLDFIIGEEMGVRAGNLLIPLGITNLRFDPTDYPTINRPRPDVRVIPTTWNENGVIGYGKVGSVHVQAGVVNSLDASKFQTPSWIRAGRQGGMTANATDVAYVFRAEHLDESSSLGTSLFTGETDQGSQAIGEANLTLASVHGEIRVDRFAARALYVEGWLGDTDRILAIPAAQAIGARARGAFVYASFDLLPRTLREGPAPPDNRELPLFVSWEYDDINAEPATGTARNPALRSDVYSIGLNYKPHPQVAIKSAFSYETDGAGGNERLVQAAIGYVF